LASNTTKALTRVLLSGAGGSGSIEMIRTLKETGHYRIVAVDASPYAFGLKLADAGYVVPMATATEFKPAIETIIAQEKPGYLIPLVDEEILACHDIAARSGVKVIAPTPEFCRLSLDKWLTWQALRTAGIATPSTWLGTENLDRIKYPAVIKPRWGRGSRGVAYLHRAEELKKYLGNAPEEPQNYVIQSLIEGKEYTVSAVVGLDGAILAVVPKEIITKRGITLVGVTRRAPTIEALCRQIQERLQANGPFNVQLVDDDSGQPHVIEINPRYSTTVALTIAAGVHEVDIVIRHAQGEPVPTPIKFVPDLMMIRYHTQEYIPETQWSFSHPEPGQKSDRERSE